MKVHLMALALGAALTMPALAADQVEKAPPSGAYKKVSEHVKLPARDGIPPEELQAPPAHSGGGRTVALGLPASERDLLGHPDR
jgi:hypothetical protein